MAALNSNTTSDFMPGIVIWLKLHMHGEKLPERQNVVFNGKNVRII